jgi:hypothetical protein
VSALLKTTCPRKEIPHSKHRSMNGAGGLLEVAWSGLWPQQPFSFDGVVAQLVERLVRNEKVRGSIPLGSTISGK